MVCNGSSLACILLDESIAYNPESICLTDDARRAMTSTSQPVAEALGITTCPLITVGEHVQQRSHPGEEQPEAEQPFQEDGHAASSLSSTYSRADSPNLITRARCQLVSLMLGWKTDIPSPAISSK